MGSVSYQNNIKLLLAVAAVSQLAQLAAMIALCLADSAWTGRGSVSVVVVAVVVHWHKVDRD